MAFQVQKGLDRRSRTHSLASLIFGPQSMRLLSTVMCERPGIPTSNVRIPLVTSIANFTGSWSTSISHTVWCTWEELEYRADLWQSNWCSTYRPSTEKLSSMLFPSTFHVCICNHFENTVTSDRLNHVPWPCIAFTTHYAVHGSYLI
jgi:hypothetical protein